MCRRNQHAKVMEVERERCDKRVQNGAPVRWPLPQLHEQQRREQHQQEEETIGARLLRNADRACIESEKSGRYHSRLATKNLPRQPICQRDAKYAGDNRQQTHRAFIASQVQPWLEHDVVGSHVSFVVPKEVPEHRSGATRDGDAGNLVEPETLVAEINQPQDRTDSNSRPQPYRAATTRDSSVDLLC